MKSLMLFLAGLVVNSKGSPSRWIAAVVMSKLRIVSMVLVSSILCLTFISSALNMILLDLQRETESQHQLAMTSLSVIGLGIVILSLTAICLFFRKSVWELPVQDSRDKERSQLQSATLAQTLSLLVTDFIDERKTRRRVKNSELAEQISNRKS